MIFCVLSARFMVFSRIAWHHCGDGLCHQRNELLLPFRFHDWARVGVLVVVEIECGLLHGSAPADSSPSP